MGIAFIEHACIDTKEIPNSLEGFGPVPHPEEVELPLTDASAYISGSLPIPPKRPFILSQLWEASKIIASDFKNKNQMWDSIGRIVYYVEVSGKNEIPELGKCPDSLCGDIDGYDFKLSDVVEFFNELVTRHLNISPGEKAILQELRFSGFITVKNGKYVLARGEFALIGMSRDFSLEERVSTFTHEFSHGLYFTNPNFRSEVDAVWNNLSESVQYFLTGMMQATGGYASGEAWLVKTEMQAYGIAKPLSDGGLTNPLFSAGEECFHREQLTQGCKAFWAYDQDIRTLMNELHLNYLYISQPYIPFMEGYCVGKQDVYESCMDPKMTPDVSFSETNFNSNNLSELQDSFNERHSKQKELKDLLASISLFFSITSHNRTH